jgi:O-antigen/teichoic acid export membrane protein
MNRPTLSNLLDQLTHKFELDVRYFVKGGIWLSMSVLLNYGLGLFRTVAFARLIDQNTYGQFGFVNSIFNSIGLLSLPGINAALIETVARGNYGSLFDAAFARARWGLLGSLGLIGVGYYYLQSGHLDLFAAFSISAIFLPILSALQVASAYYNGRKQFNTVSVMAMSLSVLTTFLLVVVLWLHQGVIWLVIANDTSILLIYLLYFWRAARLARSAPRDPQVISYGRALTWAGAISSFTFELDNAILGFSSGFVNVAIYNISSVLPDALKDFIKTLTPLVMPKIAEKPEKKIYTHETRKKLLYLLLVNVVIVLITIAILPFVITLLYGNKYNASIPFAQLLMFSLVFGLPGAFFAAALQARKQTKAIYRFNLIYGILQISTLLVFVPLLGVLGIVLSRIVTRLISTLYQWYAVARI